MSWFEAPVVRLLISLGLGLLIGVERERRKAERAVPAFAGLRTFGLVGLFGGLCAHLGAASWPITGAVLVTAFALLGYALDGTRREDPGITTEVALVVTFVLGALAERDAALASGLAVVVTGVLSLRTPLHTLVQRVLTAGELRDGLAFLLLALVVLPVVPDVAVGPYAALRPAAIARFVVLLTGLNAAGYVAQRVLGAARGLFIAGFFGGFVSSSATIAACAVRARDVPEAARAAAAGALASSIATVLEYVLLVAAVDVHLLLPLALPLGLAFVASVVATALAVRANSRMGAGAALSGGRAFRPITALASAVLLSAVALGVAALQHVLGNAGVVLASAVSGLVDAHATSASVASLHHGGSVDTATAVLALIAALSANSLTKIVMACSTRSWRFALAVSSGVLAIAAAAWLGLWLQA